MVNREESKKYHAEWYKKNKAKHCATQRRYYAKNREKCLAATQIWRDKNVDKHRQCSREHNLRTKLKVLGAYGGCKCQSCGIEDVEVLCIDHINNDGANHRKEMVGKRMYEYLIKNKFPKGFQVLCRNCNWKKLLAWKREVHK